MKYLILILMLTIIAQPVQAGVCDMETSQEAAGHMMNMDHDGADKPECCDLDNLESLTGCDDMSTCGSCSAVAPAVIEVPNNLISWLSHDPAALASGAVAPDHSYPPFHPPIS